MARSTFKVLFYVNGSKEKDGIVPIMGRVTINGTVAQFSCKQTIPKTLWDAKGNRAKGKSAEARNVNLALDNIKAQIIKHYQRISDREAYVTACLLYTSAAIRATAQSSRGEQGEGEEKREEFFHSMEFYRVMLNETPKVRGRPRCRNELPIDMK